MLTSSKFKALVNALKKYQSMYFSKKISDLDESGTRLMINTLLTDILGYTSIEEIKTEYMIKGTYADYVVQIKGVRHFLIEVKSLSIELSEKHLRQAINYGANEGIDWAVLTNGRRFELYRIIFSKPIDSQKVFSIDLSDKSQLKNSAQYLQYLHKDSVMKKELVNYWNRCLALDPKTIAGILFDTKIIRIVKKTLKTKFKINFSEEEVLDAFKKVLIENIDVQNIKKPRSVKTKKSIKNITKAEEQSNAVELVAKSE